MSNKKTQLKKSDIVYHLLKGWRIILLFTVLGLIIGIVVIGAGYIRGEMSKEYRIKSTVVVVALNEKDQFSSNTNFPYKTDVEIARELADDARYIIKSQKNMEMVIENLELRGVAPSTIANNLSVSRYESTEIIELTLTWRSEREGLQIMEEINKSSDTLLLNTMKIGRINVIDEPAASFIVGGNIGITTWIYSALVGLVIGVLFCLIRFIFGATMINSSDMEDVFEMDLLAALPFDPELAHSSVTFPEKDSVIRDDLKSLAHMLINRMDSKNLRKIYITSTSRKEGRTVVVANVALYLSQLGKRTLLIDCDLENPQLGALFADKLEYEQTLNALYRGDSDKIDAVMHVNGCLDLLPVILEKIPENFNDAMLGAMADVMKDYDYVLIDAAPVGIDAEVLRLNDIVDAALFMVRGDFATVDSIKHSVHRLRKSNVKIIGGVFNASSSWKDAFKKTKKYMDNLDKAVSKRQKKEERAKKKEAIKQNNTEDNT